MLHSAQVLLGEGQRRLTLAVTYSFGSTQRSPLMNCSEGAVNGDKQALHEDLGKFKVTSREQNFSELLSTFSLKDKKALFCFYCFYRQMLHYFHSNSREKESEEIVFSSLISADTGVTFSLTAKTTRSHLLTPLLDASAVRDC